MFYLYCRISALLVNENTIHSISYYYPSTLYSRTLLNILSWYQSLIGLHIKSQGSSNSKSGPFINRLNQVHIVKLDRSNYMLWQSMMLLVIRGNKLEDYISSTKICHPQFIYKGVEKKLNPKYEEWMTIDQLLLGWLYNSMSSKVAT